MTSTTRVVPKQNTARILALAALGSAALFALLPASQKPALSCLFVAVLSVMVLIVLHHFREPFLRGLGRLLSSWIYRVRKLGIENLPKEGGVLLLPNHLTWIDAIILQVACPRPIRFVLYEPIYRNPWLHPIFESLQAIPISAGRAKDSIRAAVAKLNEGEVVCIFPEGELSRNGMLMRLKKGFELIARQADVPVVPVWLDQLWGSIFSFRGGKFFLKWPEHFPYPVTVAFGPSIPAKDAQIDLVRQRLLELGAECFSHRPDLKNHLGRASVYGLKRKFNKELIIDGMDGSSTSAGKVLAAALTFADYIKKEAPDSKRIAVVLPPGRGAVIANLAIMLAGRVPVNLNFTAGKTALEASINSGDIDIAITAALVEKRLENFPWPPKMWYLEKILPDLKKKIVRNFILAKLLPASAIVALWKIPKVGDTKEGVLLFTSGSSGEPKGVVLSHRNILANVSQFSEMLNLGDQDAILACLPFFHSFGCTVTLWFPLVEAMRIVSYPSPLDVKKNAELIEKHRVTVLLSTPTFLRGYLRKAEPAQMNSLKLVIVGAEKLPRELAESFHARFGLTIMEGYGLTETAPVVSVNLPDPPASRPDDSPQPAYRPGSVGKPAPGVAIQIRHPDTDETLSIHESGMLWIRGSNVFCGYLNQAKKSAEVIVDGWFKTGDLGRMDDDGFLFIEGRISRFSKIGGEMVPHETVENHILQVLGITDGERPLIVMGVPDEAKGEALVVLSTIDVDLPALRKLLADAGVANLWIPKTVRRIEAIPLLGSGKVDLKECKTMALEECRGPSSLDSKN